MAPNPIPHQLRPRRFQQGPLTTALQLGPLAFLTGSWTGFGFNAIWRPDNMQPPDNTRINRFLELNWTNDGFDFQAIPGPVPNRGFHEQPDINLYGLTYLQRVSDANPPNGTSPTAGEALHIEPGLFMYVPASWQAEPQDAPIVNQNAIVRMASIPHGVTVLMQGPNPGTTPTEGPPDIPPMTPFAGYPGLNPIPFPGQYTVPPQPGPVPPGPNPPGVGIQPITTNGAQLVVPEINIAHDTLAPSSQSNGPYPESFQGYINDPNSVLRDRIAGQDIVGSIAINLTTDTLSPNGVATLGAGSLYETVSNIPFLGVANQTPPSHPPAQPATVATAATIIPNAFVYSVSATYWIEWVANPGGPLMALHEGPGQPSAPIMELEPFWGQSTYLQLQYSQLVMLIFDGVLWPHVTVGTLTLSAG